MPPTIQFEKLPLRALDGAAYSWNEVEGKPVVINFFATWCGPCMRELARLSTLHKRYAQQHLQVICISDEATAKLMPLREMYGEEIVFLQLQKELNSEGIYTYPTTYVRNAHGKIIFEKTNELPDDFPVGLALW